MCLSCAWLFVLHSNRCMRWPPVWYTVINQSGPIFDFLSRNFMRHSGAPLSVNRSCSPPHRVIVHFSFSLCTIVLFSDGYTTADIDYFWGKSRDSDSKKAVAFSDFSLPQFAATGYVVNITKATTSSGTFQLYTNTTQVN